MKEFFVLIFFMVLTGNLLVAISRKMKWENTLWRSLNKSISPKWNLPIWFMIFFVVRFVAGTFIMIFTDNSIIISAFEGIVLGSTFLLLPK